MALHDPHPGAAPRPDGRFGVRDALGDGWERLSGSRLALAGYALLAAAATAGLSLLAPPLASLLPDVVAELGMRVATAFVAAPFTVAATVFALQRAGGRRIGFREAFARLDRVPAVAAVALAGALASRIARAASPGPEPWAVRDVAGGAAGPDWSVVASAGPAGWLPALLSFLVAPLFGFVTLALVDRRLGPVDAVAEGLRLTLRAPLRTWLLGTTLGLLIAGPFLLVAAIVLSAPSGGARGLASLLAPLWGVVVLFWLTPFAALAWASAYRDAAGVRLPPDAGT